MKKVVCFAIVGIISIFLSYQNIPGINFESEETALNPNVELFLKYTGPSTMKLFGIVISDDSVMYVVGGDAAAIGKNGYVSKVTPDGKEEKFVDFKSSFVGPGVDIDKQGNLFIAGGNCIFKISKDKDIDTLLSNFSGAFDIKLDLKGNMYIADHKEDKIYKVTPSLEKSVFIDNHASVSSFILGGLAFDKEYNYLYSIEVLKKELRRYPIKEDGSAGQPEVILSNAPGIFSFDIDDQGNIFSTDFNKGDFCQINTNKELSYLTEGCRLNHPMGFRLGKPGFHNNCAFVADYQGIKKITLSGTSTTVGQHSPGKPKDIFVYPNYPNPFNPETIIKFNLPQSDRVQVSIFDVNGKIIKTILDKNVSAGIHEVKWDGSTSSNIKAASGIYFYHVRSSVYCSVNKMLLLK